MEKINSVAAICLFIGCFQLFGISIQFWLHYLKYESFSIRCFFGLLLTFYFLAIWNSYRMFSFFFSPLLWSNFLFPRKELFQTEWPANWIENCIIENFLLPFFFSLPETFSFCFPFLFIGHYYCINWILFSGLFAE